MSEIETPAIAARNRVPTKITDELPGMVAYWDRDLLCRYANRAYLEWFGKDPAALIGQSMLSLLGEQLFALNEPYIRGALRGEKQTFERLLSKADGTFGHTLANYIPDIDEAGKILGFFVLVSDVTVMKENEEKLRESENKYRILAENSADVVYYLDLNFVRQYVSRNSLDIVGYSSDELIGRGAMDQMHPADAQGVEDALRSVRDGLVERDTVIYRKRHRDGHWVWIEADLKIVRAPQSGTPSGIVGTVRDISARKQIEDQLNEANRQLARLAAQDGLTGLANRRVFEEALSREWRAAERGGTCVGLIMIDVDWFKRFNDRYGHQAGDECLRRVGGAIEAALCRPRDLAARYGGEEFVVLLPQTDDVGTALIADRIRQAIIRLGIAHADNPNGVVTVSLGYAAIEAGILEKPVLLVGLADRALYRAKELGRNRTECASGHLHALATHAANARARPTQA